MAGRPAAVACGCVPVIMRRERFLRENFPYLAATLIDWAQVVLFVEWPSSKVSATARFLERAAANATLMTRMREAGQAAYRDYLALNGHPDGAADALLAELATRSPFRKPRDHSTASAGRKRSGAAGGPAPS